ncbi:FecR family protein [Pseudotamlana agarivorans]|uniref:FecR family protein n=1 Tax=Pseudotamlana agarivorans TaxID=481183 RepID=UPI000835E888|nr:FecR family protein [Tamlana agarivorans]
MDLKLIKKYWAGNCSLEEQRRVEQFIRENPAEINQLLEKEWQQTPETISGTHDASLIKDTLLKDIQKHIDTTEKEGHPSPFNWQKLGGIAAMFIGVISIGLWYTTQNKAHTNTPINAITLTLEDGNKILINEQDTISVFNNHGKQLGQQKGTILNYNKGNGVKTLVYNTLNIPNGKTFKLQLSDGTVVNLNAGSSIKYPVEFVEGLNRQVFVTGEAYLKVAKDTAHPFIVNVNDLNIRVLGTEFNVSAYPEDETTHVVLVEGSVSMYSKKEGFKIEKNTLLKPGYKGSFNKLKYDINTKQVSTSLYTAWMEGKLIFREMHFNNILKKLERHYNVSIINNNKAMANNLFNANFGKQTLEEVLEELKVNYGLEYEINGTTISIY